MIDLLRVLQTPFHACSVMRLIVEKLLLTLIYPGRFSFLVVPVVRLDLHRAMSQHIYVLPYVRF